MIQEPIWITEEAAYAIHKRQLELHGGLDGIREPGLLSSALARPLHIFAFSQANTDIAALASAYAFGIAQNHPFIDGIKRTAAVVCESFIRLNGYVLVAQDDPMFETFRNLAAGNVTEYELVQWLRDHLQPVS